jgi:hypothetical protein
MITRKLTIIAQDPSVKKSDGKILTAQIEIPYEELSPGPRGYRLNIVDYDSTQKVFYKPYSIKNNTDEFENQSDSTLLNSPEFHAQNVYVIIMRLLTKFEFAFGRRVPWGSNIHQLNICPHAFADANAYYSDYDNGIFFGYFANNTGKTIYTCLSHDIIVHEATHALLDGIRKTYIVPSYPDQEGFHEGFADSIAILSVFGLKEVVKILLGDGSESDNHIRKDKLTSTQLKKNVLLGLAEEFGSEISEHSVESLRRAVLRKPSRNALKDPLNQESHLRGEILSAAILNSFIEVWIKRLKSWLPEIDHKVLIDRVVEDASDAADHLLKMCIRALDYCPVVDITFNEFLTSLLTADFELLIDDGKYKYREILLEEFGRWGIEPINYNPQQTKNKNPNEVGTWNKISTNESIDYEQIHKASLEDDQNEAFKFLWQNRKVLELYEDAFTQIISLRTSIRVAPDGFVLNETVCEYKQTIEVEAKSLSNINIKILKPNGMKDTDIIKMHGGGVLIFDEFGKLKYHIATRIDDPDHQNLRINYLFNTTKDTAKGRYGFTDGMGRGKKFSNSIFDVDKNNKQKDEWNIQETEEVTQ